MKNESHMMSYGYNPEWSEGSVKPPVFQTSTFVFKNAEARARVRMHNLQSGKHQSRAAKSGCTSVLKK